MTSPDDSMLLNELRIKDESLTKEMYENPSDPDSVLNVLMKKLQLNGFPPEGVYVIISSDTVTVTNQTVDIGTAEDPEEETEPEGESQDEEAAQDLPL
jgi:hypothetical protein